MIFLLRCFVFCGTLRPFLWSWDGGGVFLESLDALHRAWNQGAPFPDGVFLPLGTNPCLLGTPFQINMKPEKGSQKEVLLKMVGQGSKGSVYGLDVRLHDS